MSHREYRKSLEIQGRDYPFYALIMAAMRQGDGRNGWLLRQAFPETWRELQDRYDAPGGYLPGETHGCNCTL